MKTNVKRFALGTLLAAVGGYLAGLLTAPKSGKDIRKNIKDSAVKSVNESEKQLKKAHTELNDLLGDAKDKGDKLSGKAREDYDIAVNSANIAKQKAREILSAVHEGEAGDSDLQKALKDAAKAIKHLRDYLKK